MDSSRLPHTKLLDPRFVDVALQHIKDLDEMAERKRKLDGRPQPLDVNGGGGQAYDPKGRGQGGKGKEAQAAAAALKKD